MTLNVFLNSSIYTLVSEDALIKEFQLRPEAWLHQLVWDGALMKLLRMRIIKSTLDEGEQLAAWHNTQVLLERALGVTSREMEKLIETPVEHLFTSIRRLLMEKAGKKV